MENKFDDEVVITAEGEVIDSERTYRPAEATALINKRLGTTYSDQSIRNIAIKFEKYLNFSKTSTRGNRVYTDANIDMIVRIIQIRDERKITLDETYEYLESHAFELAGNLNNERFNVTSEKFLELFGSVIKTQMDKVMEDKMNEFADKINESLLAMQKATEASSLLLEQKENQNQELLQQIDDSNRKVEQLELELNELKIREEQHNKEIEELKNKKRPIFGFFKQS